MLQFILSILFILSIFCDFSIQGSDDIDGDTKLIKEIFDPNYYKTTYKSCISDSIDPLDHFMQSGWKEGYNPNSWFDTKLYLKFFPQQEVTNPVLTWMKQPHGIKEENQSANEQLVVSITSHPPRIGTAWLSIQSIFNQTRKANKVILYLAVADFPQRKIPRSLEILKKMGLEIRFSDINYKVATKLLPALKDFHFTLDQTTKTNIVTADDDRCYDPQWLEVLWKQHTLYPSDIISPASRKYVFQRYEEDLRYSRIDYLAQKMCYDTAEFGIFEGFGGVFYPPTAFNEEVLNFDNFKLLTPCADDVWYQVMAILNSTKSRGLPEAIHAQFQWPKELDGTQESGLFHEHLNGNDWMAYRALKYYGIIERAGIPVIDDAHCRTCRRKVLPFSFSAIKESSAEDLSLILVPDDKKKTTKNCKTCFNTLPKKILCIGECYYGGIGDGYYEQALKHFLSTDYDVVSVPDTMRRGKSGNYIGMQSEESDFEFDYLIVGGGGILRDLPSELSISYYVNLANKLKKPYFLISAGFQPENSDFTQEDSAKVIGQSIDLLRGASLITLRSMCDYLKMHNVLDASIEHKIFVKPDLGYLAKEVIQPNLCRKYITLIQTRSTNISMPDIRKKIEAGLVTYPGSELVVMNWGGIKNLTKSKDFVECDFFTKKACEFSAHANVFMGGSYSKKLKRFAYPKQKIREADLDLQTAVAIIAQSHLVITSRYHGFVFAKAFGVPCETPTFSDKIQEEIALLEREEAIDNIHLIKDFIENDEGIEISPSQWEEDERNYFICKLHDIYPAHSISCLQSMTNTTLFNLLRYRRFQNLADMDKKRIRKLTFVPANNSPIAKYCSESVDKNTTIPSSLAYDTDSDSDTGSDILTYTVNTTSEKGGVTFNTLTKENTYTSNHYFTDQDSFTYKVIDGNRDTSSTQPSWVGKIFNWFLSWWY